MQYNFCFFMVVWTLLRFFFLVERPCKEKERMKNQCPVCYNKGNETTEVQYGEETKRDRYDSDLAYHSNGRYDHAAANRSICG